MLVEKAFQLPLFDYKKNLVTVSDFLPLLESIKVSQKPIVIFFEGNGKIRECSQKLKELLELNNGNHTIARLHFQHVRSPGSWMDVKHDGYSDTSVLYNKGPQIIIVDEFESFKKEHLKTVLGAIDEAPAIIKWVFLVPSWGPHIKPSEILTEWILKNNPPQFLFNPG